MNCPVCNDVRMREVEKEGVLIDICPSCKGVWLDRGELDKLMSGVREVRQEFNQWYETKHRDDDHYRKQDPHYDNRSHHDRHGDHDHYKKKKKSSVLDMFGDLFGD